MEGELGEELLSGHLYNAGGKRGGFIEEDDLD